MKAESVMGCGKADTTAGRTPLTGSAFMLFPSALADVSVPSGCALCPALPFPFWYLAASS